MYNILNFNLPQNNKNINDHKFLGNVIQSSDAFVLAKIKQQFNGLCLVVTPDSQSAFEIWRNSLAVMPELSDKIVLFPEWETLPYDPFSPHQDIISKRLLALNKLLTAQVEIFILPIHLLAAYIAPREFLQQNLFIIKTQDKINLTKLQQQLSLSGYRKVEQVFEHGEFAIRGSLLDLFAMGADQPFRIDFLDDEIDSIRTFDIDSQISTGQIDNINLMPAHEFPTDNNAIELFRTQFRQNFEQKLNPEHIYQQVSKGILPAGIEYWQSLFFAKMNLLFDYLPDETLVVDYTKNTQNLDEFLSSVETRYQSYKVDPNRPLLEPKKIWISTDKLNHLYKKYPRLTLSENSALEYISQEDGSLKAKRSSRKQDLNVAPLPEIHSNHLAKNPFEKFTQFEKYFNGKIILCSQSIGRRESLRDLCLEHDLNPQIIDNFNDSSNNKLNLLLAPLAKGFIFTPDNKDKNSKKVAIVCESDLFYHVKAYKTSSNNKKHIKPETIIRHLSELKIGQAVVHLEHGIGQYDGLVTLNNRGFDNEFLVVKYQGEAKIYVPVTNLHLISRYSSANEEVTLHKLGNDRWNKERSAALKKIQDSAAQLLDIYAKRKIKQGFSFKYDHTSFKQFADSFSFDLTEDQELAINAVIQDMCSKNPMDRLICGDVGFGKTEVAMQASFLAVNNAKQVMLLVPTTLLAQQHYTNFLDRFSDFAISVEVLSRFKTAKQQKELLEKLADGKIDILIGTHKLLQEQVKFKDLGLLIVDEEHRFGVKQKEQIKKFRANIDILTLSATPIPRTLNMAISAMRDLSIISSPPAKRLSIKTFVCKKEDLIIKEAILREILRGGQVYYLHNEVSTIENAAQYLSELIPNAQIAIAHGQMPKREFERVTNEFYHQRYNVLVCSTIIETGIDIPSANTIIIDRADKFGLAQLHQIRGRVGRSHHQAYAYLMIPNEKLITSDARKRLDALTSIENLGAGFMLATHDLEIRGAGEILGENQSGQIQTIGYSLYTDMLEQAVKSLQNGEELSLNDILEQQTEMDLGISAIIPSDYVHDTNIRLSTYKKIASANNSDELNSLQIEIIDRFGSPPAELRNLFIQTRLKLAAIALNIKKIDANKNGGYLEFNPKTKVNPDKIIQLITTNPVVYKLEGSFKLKFRQNLTEIEKRLIFVEKLLASLL